MSFNIFVELGYGARIKIPAATIEHEKIIDTGEDITRKIDFSFDELPTIEYIDYWEWFWRD